jgi:hypothetical protein
MAEKHKSKYKKPENSKPTYRKDLKDYTLDDKAGKLNPRTTGDKQLNVLRKTDKEMQDDGKMYPTYANDDRLYKDIEDGDYDPKTAAKRLKKRQDDEEKDVKDVLKDKIENLTREGKERLVREYIRRKIAKVLKEQTEPEAPAEETPAAETPAAEAPAAEAPADPAAAPTDAAAPAPPADPATPPADPAAAATPAPAAEPKPDADAAAQKEIDPATKEALDLDRFVKYLKKQEGNVARVKIILKALNLSMHNADPADKSNFFKMMRTASIKQLAKLGSEETANNQSE